MKDKKGHIQQITPPNQPVNLMSISQDGISAILLDKEVMIYNLKKGIERVSIAFNELNVKYEEVVNERDRLAELAKKYEKLLAEKGIPLEEETLLT